MACDSMSGQRLPVFFHERVFEFLFLELSYSHGVMDEAIAKKFLYIVGSEDRPSFSVCRYIFLFFLLLLTTPSFPFPFGSAEPNPCYRLISKTNRLSVLSSEAAIVHGVDNKSGQIYHRRKKNGL